jgi:hypothetical protein
MTGLTVLARRVRALAASALVTGVFVAGGVTVSTGAGASSIGTSAGTDVPAASPVALDPAGVPDAPTAVSAAAGDATASVFWQAPDDRGSAIVSYTVVVYPPCGGCTTVVTGTTAAVSGLANGASYSFAVSATNGVGAGPFSDASAPVTPEAASTAYWIATPSGGVVSVGGAPFFGDLRNIVISQPVVGMAVTPDKRGYWLVAADGGIFTFGDAHFFGSMGAKHLNAPIVGIAVTPTGGGYWEVASDGGIFSFGTAGFYGSMGGQPLNAPIVSMIPTSTGDGYWMVATDGGLFAFGAAPFYGSTGGQALSSPVIAMIAEPGGGGYWMVDRGGVLTPYGQAPPALRPASGTVVASVALDHIVP